jgi:hypothetical protein
MGWELQHRSGPLRESLLQTFLIFEANLLHRDAVRAARIWELVENAVFNGLKVECEDP